MCPVVRTRASRDTMSVPRKICPSKMAGWGSHRTHNFNEGPSPMPTESAASNKTAGLVCFGLALADWSERCFPDPVVLALLGILVIFLAGLILRQSATCVGQQESRPRRQLQFNLHASYHTVGGFLALLKRKADLESQPIDSRLPPQCGVVVLQLQSDRLAGIVS
jgi:hypothetical protein